MTGQGSGARSRAGALLQHSPALAQVRKQAQQGSAAFPRTGPGAQPACALCYPQAAGLSIPGCLQEGGKQQFWDVNGCRNHLEHLSTILNHVPPQTGSVRAEMVSGRRPLHSVAQRASRLLGKCQPLFRRQSLEPGHPRMLGFPVCKAGTETG